MMLRKALLFVSVFMTQAAAAFVSQEGTFPNISELSGTKARPNYNYFGDVIDLKPIKYFELSNIFYLQKSFVEERLVDLDADNYTIKYTAESASTYLNVPELSFDSSAISVTEREAYLRQISGRMLGLLLYRLGGDGTDHNCQSWLTKQLPRAASDVHRNTWYAHYSGVVIDLAGQCREFGGNSAIYITVQVVYHPASQTGEIFVGVENLLGGTSRLNDLYSE